MTDAVNPYAGGDKATPAKPAPAPKPPARTTAAAKELALARAIVARWVVEP